MDVHELIHAHEKLVESFLAHVLPAYRQIQAAMGYTFAVCGIGASSVDQDDPCYLDAWEFAARMARENVLVVAGGPYTKGGRGRGVQHALHEGAHYIDPQMSIGCELIIPAWGLPAFVPCEPNLRNPDLLVTRLPTMLTLSSCFVAFGRAAFGTDLERALIAQLLWFIRTLSVEGLPEEVLTGNMALRCGFVPKLILVGDAYEYARMKVKSWVDAGLVPEDVGGEDQGIYTYLADAQAAGDLVLSERDRYRKALRLVGQIAEN